MSVREPVPVLGVVPLLPVMLLLSLFSMGQDLHFSQFFNSPLTTNPANTGYTLTADDVGAVDGSKFRVCRDHPDAVMGLLVQHVEAHIAAAVGRRVEGHRTGDEREAQVTLPGRTRGHA